MAKKHLLMPSVIENCLPFKLPLAMFIISNGKKISATKFVCHFKLYKRKKISSGKKNCLPRENMRGSLTGSKTGFMTWNFCCCCCNVTGGVRLLNLRLLQTQLNFYRIQGIPAFRDFIIRDPCCFVILFQASNSTPFPDFFQIFLFLFKFVI